MMLWHRKECLKRGLCGLGVVLSVMRLAATLCLERLPGSFFNDGLSSCCGAYSLYQHGQFVSHEYY